MQICLTLFFAAFTTCTLAQAPIHEWSFAPGQIKERALSPIAGGISGTISGPFSAKPHPESISLVGTSKAGNEIILSDDISSLNLPTAEITVEAWVQIDRPQKWGGIIGAIQDNGNYERGWLLGYNENAFYFALASEHSKRLTYLNSTTAYTPGYWYHVVGTYDGKKLSIYLDGELAGSSEAQRGTILYPPKGWFVLASYKDDNENYAMAGQLERVTVWDTALDAQTVSARFEARKNQFPGVVPDFNAQQANPQWPTYMHDNQRSGESPLSVQLPLHKQWTYINARAPAPAWPPPAKQDFWHSKQTLKARVTYDRGFHLVSDGAGVFFGSSSEDFVTRLDAGTGEASWRTYTEAPVRLAPTLVGDRLFVGSDDGYVYCLNKHDGTLIYKTRPETASDRRIPGNERIISLWPVRTSVLVEGKTGFFGSGIFPSQGAFHCSFDLATGKILDRKPLDVSPQGYLEQKNGQLFVPTGRVLAGKFLSGLKRRGKANKPAVKSIPADYPYAFIGTPELKFGGGENKIAALDAKTGEEQWMAEVEGRVYSLALADGRLFASTDAGRIYAFDSEKAPNPPTHTPSPLGLTESKDNDTAPAGLQGYGLILIEDLSLLDPAWIAANPAMRFVVASRSESVAASAVREKFGLPFHRVADTKQLPYTDYLFNLIVAETMSEDIMRVLHPKGTAIVLSEPDVHHRRPPLKGIGEWTHLYADPSNSTASKDEHASQDMQLQWFGAPGPANMVDRHHRSISSLWKDGRVLIPGNERVYGVDAYNGYVQWETEVPGSRRVGIFRDTGSMAVNSEGLYVAAGATCQVLDVTTGEMLRSFKTPRGGEWGYLALADGLLFGSEVKPGGIRREHSKKQIYEGTYFDNKPIVVSERMFVMDQQTGETLWEYLPSGAMLNPSMTVGHGKLYVLESNAPDTLTASTGRVPPAQLLNQSGAKIVAIDMTDGSISWEEKLTFPPEVQNLFMVQGEGKIAMVYSRNEKTVRYDVRVFDAGSGNFLWETSQDNRQKTNGDHGEQDHHPVLTNGRLIVEPVAYDLDSGKVLEHQLRRPGHGCGSMSASANALFFRAGNPTVYDFASKSFTKLTKVSRPGCWINMIPAGGLLLVPESSSGCTCNFAVQTSMAFIPKLQEEK